VHGQYIDQPKFPASLGYEAAGVVEAVGPDVDKSWIGKRVATIPCGTYGAPEGVALRKPKVVPHSLRLALPDGIFNGTGRGLTGILAGRPFECDGRLFFLGRLFRFAASMIFVSHSDSMPQSGRQSQGRQIAMLGQCEVYS
jgi:hypothetical protein